MATVTLRHSTALASEPTFDGTEDIEPDWADGEWARPALSDHPEAEEGDDFADLDGEAQTAIRERFIQQDGEAYSELGYPVVNPSTGRLNRNAVAAAKSRSSADGDGDVEAIANDLWDEHFADEDMAAETEIVLSTGGPSVITRKTTRENSGVDYSRSEALPTEMQTLRSRAQEGQRLSAPFKSRRTESLQATGSRLDRINSRHSDRELTEDDVVLFRDFAVHNLNPQAGMRRPLQFTMGALQKFRQDFRQGRTMNVHHNGERQVGTTFDAEIMRDREVRGITADWLVVDWYAPTLNASEQRLQDITDMETGVLRYTSIEFAGGDWEEETMETADGETFFFRIDDNDGGGQERLEAEGIARVALGAVRGAGST